MPDLTFPAWRQALLLELTRLGHTLQGERRSGGVIDCRVPWRLGWTVHRTARALLMLDAADNRFLSDEQVKEESDHA